MVERVEGGVGLTVKKCLKTAFFNNFLSTAKIYAYNILTYLICREAR